MTVLTEDHARAIVANVLRHSKADEASVFLSGLQKSHLRFARNEPSTSGSYESPSLVIRSSYGRRSGSAQINQFDDRAVAEAVARSEEMASLAPDDPEFVSALPPQQYTPVDAYSTSTVVRGADGIARGVALCTEAAAASDLAAAGFSEVNARYEAIGNSKGLFGYHRFTSAYIAETVRTADGSGSGWASQAATGIEALDFAAVSRTAIKKAVASQKPRALEPGRYTTILEPACVANLVTEMIGSMNARSADEGRSFFSASKGNRIGETLFGDSLTIYSDPAHPVATGSPWSGDGIPERRRSWIEKGVLENLIYDRYWAQAQGREPILHPSNTIMTGGSGTIDDLIASTERGVLITSLWYIRSLDPRSLLLTGLTRDGVFWIEDGTIAYPLTNFRWNDSPIAVLENVVSMSASVQVAPRPSHQTNIMVPALKVSGFTLSSTSDAV